MLLAILPSATTTAQKLPKAPKGEYASVIRAPADTLFAAAQEGLVATPEAKPTPSRTTKIRLIPSPRVVHRNTFQRDALGGK